MTPNLEIPDLVPTRPAWMERGACAGSGCRLFLSEYERDVQRAKVVCNRCQVREACCAFAVADPSLQGVWGATTASERRALRRRRTISVMM
jgi:WhiB family redox-sensing transcriptional regulator